MVTYTTDGYWEYTRFEPTDTTLFVETDGANPFEGTPIFSAPVEEGFPDVVLTDDATDGFQIGEDLSGFGNLFHGTVTAQVNGVDTQLLMVTGGEGGVPDFNSFVVLLPDGVDPNDVELPRSVSEDQTLGELNTNTYFCFAAGTLFTTTMGEVAVEDLTRDHRVVTADGRAVPVHWLGRQRIATRFVAGDAPIVEIAMGALGDGLPARDLRVTGDHALLIDGMLVNASTLVNGGSVRFVPRADLGEVVTVYHVETQDHEALLAEGVACESFIDYAGRARQDNYAEYLEVHGADRVITEMDLPRISSARMLPEALRARLAGVCAEGASDAA